ncbi:MAG: GatB/YqeY domain-containing protein [Rhodospirillaceae bacterium]|nr:GatB/YqeY domain-containing protein [Rhodospirillaceae bacterium]MBT6138940.1 GatB/YqeY domain-containing protein [Rhodospirillaceae bacterium]
MLREQLNSSMKDAMRAKEERALATIRLILAALKDRDIAARGNGNQDGIEEPEILSLLQTMIKQRNESIRMYEEGGRLELAEQEREEIEVIERFMPKQLDGGELETAVNEAIKEIGAADMKDMGRTMALLKERYPGRMDFSKASGLVRAVLA